MHELSVLAAANEAPTRDCVIANDRVWLKASSLETGSLSRPTWMSTRSCGFTLSSSWGVRRSYCIRASPIASEPLSWGKHSLRT
jgi:hypothetical protein